jgi:hypothetical protein
MPLPPPTPREEPPPLFSLARFPFFFLLPPGGGIAPDVDTRDEESKKTPASRKRPGARDAQ